MSKKVTSADNQQERIKLIGWIVGFTEGIEKIAKISAQINQQKIPKFLKSSETIRRSPIKLDKI